MSARCNTGCHVHTHAGPVAGLWRRGTTWSVPSRPATREARRDLVSTARTFLGMAPRAQLIDVAKQLHVSPRTLQRAFELEGTSLLKEKQAIQLDLAAVVLLERSARRQGPALHTAARAAGDRRSRHLCAPFQARYGDGVTPGVVWRIGCSVRELLLIAKSPQEPARKDPARYMRRRRRLLRAKIRLESIRPQLKPDTVVWHALTSALAAVESHPTRRAAPLPVARRAPSRRARAKARVRERSRR